MPAMETGEERTRLCDCVAPERAVSTAMKLHYVFNHFNLLIWKGGSGLFSLFAILGLSGQEFIDWRMHLGL
jgi:hypothetical protein